MSTGATPSQTIGPFFAFGLEWLDGCGPVPPGTDASHELEGAVTDGDGVAVPDAVVEVWQPGTGFGRCLVDAEGRYRFRLGPGSPLEVTVFARGLLNRLVTRCYLPGTAADDPLLELVPPERRATLEAVVVEAGGLRFDIRLQGPDETVFLGW